MNQHYLQDIAKVAQANRTDQKLQKSHQSQRMADRKDIAK